MSPKIEPMKPSDAERVLAIYQEGIETGVATFETEAPDWATWDRDHLQSCRLVARLDGEVAGWAALSPASGRCVYGGVAEVSIYVAAAARGYIPGVVDPLIVEAAEDRDNVDLVLGAGGNSLRGQVKDVGIARVTLNATDLGVVWRPPFRVDVTKAVRRGENKLEVTVVNSWRNRLIGDRELPENKRLTRTNINVDKSWKREPSGLLGPVHLQTAEMP